MRDRDLSSYRRRYETRYLWQDLLDDDLITPIPDHEYVLRISDPASPFETVMFGPRKASILNEEIPVQVYDTEGKQLQQKHPLLPKELQLERFPYFKPNSPDKLSSEMSSDRSTLADGSESGEVEADKLENHSLYFSLYQPNSMNMSKHQRNETDKTDTSETLFYISLSSSSSSSSSLSPLKGSKRFSTGASNLFRNLITCG
ncbi:uncharacterized protein LOC114731391 [Neltuma alba]|uniref:uncharacterized protein LOC114731391 n=1 Tax=Neltuma alba TaxID=207710 RepID=UPI0010A3070D|nr:uncharacterized protein LOC114731391 [Prosopis alba]